MTVNKTIRMSVSSTITRLLSINAPAAVNVIRPGSASGAQPSPPSPAPASPSPTSSAGLKKRAINFSFDSVDRLASSLAVAGSNILLAVPELHESKIATMLRVFLCSSCTRMTCLSASSPRSFARITRPRCLRILRYSSRSSRSSRRRVYVCGDMGRGQSLIVWAIAEGRSCAAAVDADLMGETLLPSPVKPTDRPLT